MPSGEACEASKQPYHILKSATSSAEFDDGHDHGWFDPVLIGFLGLICGCFGFSWFKARKQRREYGCGAQDTVCDCTKSESQDVFCRRVTLPNSDAFEPRLCSKCKQLLEKLKQEQLTALRTNQYQTTVISYFPQSLA